MDSTTHSYLQLPAALADQLEDWAAASYPYESCGLILGHSDGRRTVAKRSTRGRNLDRKRPKDRYVLDPDDYLSADREARNRGLEIVGVWHSHPDHPAQPSQTDLEAAWEDFSYLIITTTASGATDLRSWRLNSGRFLQETVRREDSAA